LVGWYPWAGCAEHAEERSGEVRPWLKC
jgi:hypothetical protein